MALFKIFHHLIACSTDISDDANRYAVMRNDKTVGVVCVMLFCKGNYG